MSLVKTFLAVFAITVCSWAFHSNAGATCGDKGKEGQSSCMHGGSCPHMQGMAHGSMDSSVPGNFYLDYASVLGLNEKQVAKLNELRMKSSETELKLEQAILGFRTDARNVLTDAQKKKLDELKEKGHGMSGSDD